MTHLREEEEERNRLITLTVILLTHDRKNDKITSTSLAELMIDLHRSVNTQPDNKQ